MQQETFFVSEFSPGDEEAVFRFLASRMRNCIQGSEDTEKERGKEHHKEKEPKSVCRSSKAPSSMIES